MQPVTPNKSIGAIANSAIRKLYKRTTRRPKEAKVTTPFAPKEIAPKIITKFKRSKSAEVIGSDHLNGWIIRMVLIKLKSMVNRQGNNFLKSDNGFFVTFVEEMDLAHIKDKI